jgi:hypothetical protein
MERTLNKDGNMEIKYDASTLPQDEEIIQYRDYTGAWHRGLYLAQDKMFFSSKNEWSHIVDVDVWKPIEGGTK